MGMIGKRTFSVLALALLTACASSERNGFDGIYKGVLNSEVAKCRGAKVQFYIKDNVFKGRVRKEGYADHGFAGKVSDNRVFITIRDKSTQLGKAYGTITYQDIIGTWSYVDGCEGSFNLKYQE